MPLQESDSEMAPVGERKNGQRDRQKSRRTDRQSIAKLDGQGQAELDRLPETDRDELRQTETGRGSQNQAWIHAKYGKGFDTETF